MWLDEGRKRFKEGERPWCARREARDVRGCVLQHVRACAGPKQQTKAGPRGKQAARGAGDIAVRAHPPESGAAALAEGATKGENGCARTGALPPPSCFLGTMGENNGRARERGRRSRKERDAEEREIRAEDRAGGAAAALSPASPQPSLR